MTQLQPSWTIAIFTARESIETLTRCVSAALLASKGKRVVIDVLVNGNKALAQQATEALTSRATLPPGQDVRIWFIRFGDKAHAWNEYVHRIWQPSDITFFVDGYSEVRPDALSRVESGLRANSEPLGASAVPTSGRSATALRTSMIKNGGIHGNLHAIRGHVVAEMRAGGIRLPIGLYRTDSLIGAILNYRLDPASHKWDPRRILIQADATWDVRGSSWWHPKNLNGHVKRRLRQAQGALENLAVREHLAVARKPPASLPRTINELVNGWIAADTRRARGIFIKNPLAFIAARKFREPRDWSDADIAPELISAPTPRD